MVKVFAPMSVKKVNLGAVSAGSVLKKLPTFWQLQIGGWLVYLAMIYITFLTVAPEGALYRLFEIKVIRTIIGFVLTCAMRPIYKHFTNRLSIQKTVLLALGVSIVFGMIWTGAEMTIADWRTDGYDVWANLARSPRSALDYGMTLTAWSALYFGIKYWQQWQEERENILLERENALAAIALANQAQLEMLRYQLNPHFLFNSLNSLRASIDEDSARAKQMVTQLADFLRHSLQNGDCLKVSLADELEAAKNYLAIEKVRFEEKLQIFFDVEEAAKTFRVPCFLLNPLVENAVKHGFKNGAANPLEIRIAARVQNNELFLEVTNTGKLSQKSEANGTRIGLKNVRERLSRLFQGKSDFRLYEDNGLVRAVVLIEE
ncbi:MAG TPA: histidine kinase [Pyrinomonadaceae bacterium]|jgi:two-component sensor histidine kinase